MAHEVAIRKRAVSAVEEKGKPKAAVVSLFGISLPSLNRWLKQKREQGHVEIGHSPGRDKKLDEQGRQWLTKQVQARPDATLAERCELLKREGYEQLSPSTMHRLLAGLGITRKKKLITIPNAMNSPGGAGAP